MTAYNDIIEFIKALLVPVMGIIAFFLIRLINQVDKLTETVNRIENTISASNEKVKNITDGCHEKHDNIAKTMDNHEKRINKLEIKVG